MIVELGGGKNPRQETDMNIDVRDFDTVDRIADIENGIPIADNSASYVLAYHILEHISDLPFVMNEIWRILCNGGRLIGRVPHYKDSQAWHDPTHTRYFTCKSFDYWDSERKYGKNFEYFDAEFRVRNVSRVSRLRFWKPRPIEFDLLAIKRDI